MEVQYEGVLREKILLSTESPLPQLTKRDAIVPKIADKAVSVIGMRRSGKTCFLHQQRAERIAAGKAPEQLIYLNFEDERLAGLSGADLGLIPTIHHRLYPQFAENTLVYFLDEIQVIDGWERFVRRLLDERSSEIFVSGSSAKLLSREIATSMRGRGWELLIHPFGFREYLRHHDIEPTQAPDHLTGRKQAVMDRRFADYLGVGGFPEAQGLDTASRRQLLQGYVDVVLLRDIIERHRVSNVTALRWMTRRLLANPGCLFSITRFDADLKSQGIPAGRETLYHFLAYMEDAFLLRAIPVATDSEKRRQVNPRKIYPIDHSLGPVFDRSPKSNTGHALEVAVHNALVRQGAETAYVKTKEGFEVDFLSRNPDGSQWLVQACANLADSNTLDRECRALLAAARERPADRLLLLTAESALPLPSVPKPIEILPAWRWMLDAP